MKSYVVEKELVLHNLALLQKKAGDREMDIAQGKLKKAVNRIRIAESK